MTYLRELVFQAPQVEPIYISGQSQRADGQTKILSGQPLREAQQHFNLVPHSVPTEQVTAPEPPPVDPKVVQVSPLFKLAKRLSRKTSIFPTGQPPREVQKVEETPVQPSMEAQEASEMAPPDPPRPRETELPISSRSGEPGSGTSNYESAEEPEEEVTSLGRRKRNWASITPSAVSETEMGDESVDLQSHDPRPESVAMAGWAQGLSVPTASIADFEQPVFTKPLVLDTSEKVMEAGRLIDSTLPLDTK